MTRGTCRVRAHGVEAVAAKRETVLPPAGDLGGLRLGKPCAEHGAQGLNRGSDGGPVAQHFDLGRGIGGVEAKKHWCAQSPRKRHPWERSQSVDQLPACLARPSGQSWNFAPFF